MINPEDLQEFSLNVNNWCKSKKDINNEDILNLFLASFLTAAEGFEFPSDFLESLFAHGITIYKKKEKKHK